MAAFSSSCSLSQLQTNIVGFIPGTGRMAVAIATHLAKAGFTVMLGSRDAQRAAQTAQDLLFLNPHAAISGCSNEDVASSSHIIFWSPRGSLQDRQALLRSMAAHLENKIIIDVTNILYFMSEREWGQTSSTLINQKALGVPARWTTAFKSTFAKLLEERPADEKNPHHTFVAGDDEEAVETTIALVNCVPGFKGIKAGGLQNTKILELLGPNWLIELDHLNEGHEMSGWRFGA